MAVTQSVKALSLTVHVKDWLANTRHPRILHAFDSACNLINERREVLSVVTPHIGKGPFNIVIQDELILSERPDVESPIIISAEQLILGNISIDITNAEVWNSRPNWEILHHRRDLIIAQVKQLPVTEYQFPNALASSLAIADLHSAHIAAKQLAGLGQGLTPAGDDFIMGALYAAWIIHPLEIAQTLAVGVADLASALTTSLSAAWIRSAGRGEAGILWHDFFEALVSGNTAQIQTAMNKILAVGETSGADALSGFMNTFMAWATEVNIQHE